jgi:hypothetical protein
VVAYLVKGLLGLENARDQAPAIRWKRKRSSNYSLSKPAVPPSLPPSHPPSLPHRASSTTTSRVVGWAMT